MQLFLRRKPASDLRPQPPVTPMKTQNSNLTANTVSLAILIFNGVLLSGDQARRQGSAANPVIYFVYNPTDHNARAIIPGALFPRYEQFTNHITIFLRRIVKDDQLNISIEEAK